MLGRPRHPEVPMDEYDIGPEDVRAWLLGVRHDLRPRGDRADRVGAWMTACDRARSARRERRAERSRRAWRTVAALAGAASLILIGAVLASNNTLRLSHGAIVALLIVAVLLGVVWAQGRINGS